MKPVIIGFGLLILALLVLFQLAEFTHFRLSRGIDTWYQWEVQQLKQSLPAVEFAARIKDMEKYKAWGSNPFFQFLSCSSP
jgi:hypothetical protein